jgi:preprotein translocase subunit SecB
VQHQDLDLAAVTRVARNIDLRDIRIVKVEASSSPAPSGPLEPRITFDTNAALVADNLLNVACIYTLTVNAGEVCAATINTVYLLTYEVTGGKPSEQDIRHFANANGVYHSWPFLRQFLADMTAKMGFPPLTLPVFQVLPRTAPERKLKDMARAPKRRKALPKGQ